VDVASGEQFTAAHDVEVPGVSPLIFRRVYNTALLERPVSVLGKGWVHAFEASLTRDLDGFLFEGHDGDSVEFDDIKGDFEQHGSLYNSAASMELRREGERLVVYHWHDVDEPVQKYIFDAREGERMLLIGRELPSGEGLEIARDRLGRVVSVTQNSERRRLYFTYDRAGRLEALQLGLASRGIEAALAVARYRYDERSRLVGVQNALGAEQRYDYDDAGRLTLEQDRRGGTYRMRYDARGRCVEVGGDGDYQLRRFVYEPGRMTRVLDSLGRETLYQYNERGQVERRIEPNGATHVTEFDDAGRITKEINPLGATTSYAYDERGHLVRKTLPNGATLSYEYDEFHQPTRITEPDGATWILSYQLGALVELIDPYQRRTRYVRDRNNQLIGALSPAGQELVVRTNESRTEETVSDELGVLLSRKLDIYLNSTHIEDAGGPVHRAEYDSLGRLVGVERPDGSKRRFEYDPEGKITRIVDARGGEWRARYSAYGNCVEQVDPLGRTHRFRWDTEGRIVEIENPRRETASFTYDLVGNLTCIRHFDGSVEEARFDLAARLVARKRRDGSDLRFGRDAVGNLLSVHCDQLELRRFAYDLCGSVISARSADAELLFEYEVGGRIRAEVQNGRRVDFEFGPRGLLEQRSFAGSKVGPLRFEHDTRGRLRRFSVASGQVQVFNYDASNRCTERSLGRVSEQRKYDLQGRLRYQDVPGVTTRTFEYDAEGALVELVDKLRGRRRFVYDAAEQLLSSVNEKLASHSYSYDENGNLASKDALGSRYGSGNQLQQFGDRVFARDVHGQMVRQTSAERDDRYEWDALGQLTCVKHGSGAETRFGYDAIGRRVFKHHQPAPAASTTLGDVQSASAPSASLAVRTHYYWAGDDLLAEERAGQLVEYATWGFVTSALWEDGRLRHVINSAQGVPQELVDDAGNLVWQGTFDDWGKLISETGTTTCRLRLPGQIVDEETGLHYNRFRYYSPDAGQFVSADPLGFLAGTNDFRFAPNGVNWIDPLGLVCGKDGCTTKPEDAKPRDLHAEAVAARDALAADLAKSRHPPATVVGAYSPSTGQVTAAASRGGGLGCAEGACAQALGNPPDIQFTTAVRPRTGGSVDVCPTCESTYGRGAFPDPATRFKTDR
jgi:RHS repeat-associated protein